jgi:hypothetical protein
MCTVVNVLLVYFLLKKGVAAAAKRFNEKQKQMSEKEEKHTKAKKIKKVQRDEMAARHEQRQQVLGQLINKN